MERDTSAHAKATPMPSTPIGSSKLLARTETALAAKSTGTPSRLAAKQAPSSTETEQGTGTLVAANADPPAHRAGSPDVSAITAVKLPPYYASDPQVWFGVVESLFRTRNISRQSTKFHHVISSLSADFATEVRDLILNPPEDAPFDQLKARLIQRTQLSEQRRIRLLLSEEELGDRKPTQLLRRMQQLLDDHTMDDGLFRELFIQRLPEKARLILASSSEALPLEDLATMADRILAVSPEANAIMALRPAAASMPDSTVARLERQIAELTAAVSALAEPRFRGRSTSRSSTPSHSRSSTPTRDVCFYHHRFGDRARHCRSPCSFKRQENAQASK
ncbi:uncharacterized protein LOC135828856 [Sycon ciliatum]|uniref:uncharacterized protein LOC135828856 n=3 Tax=Sycon ciliatum TaxID=27933 RepID=UPI0031F6504B|eukprot:scpid56566/ scgid27007/ 